MCWSPTPRPPSRPMDLASSPSSRAPGGSANRPEEDPSPATRGPGPCDRSLGSSGRRGIPPSVVAWTGRRRTVVSSRGGADRLGGHRRGRVRPGVRFAPGPLVGRYAGACSSASCRARSSAARWASSFAARSALLLEEGLVEHLEEPADVGLEPARRQAHRLPPGEPRQARRKLLRGRHLGGAQKDRDHAPPGAATRPRSRGARSPWDRRAGWFPSLSPTVSQRSPISASRTSQDPTAPFDDLDEVVPQLDRVHVLEHLVVAKMAGQTLIEPTGRIFGVVPPIAHEDPARSFPGWIRPCPHPAPTTRAARNIIEATSQQQHPSSTAGRGTQADRPRPSSPQGPVAGPFAPLRAPAR
jgi:hypothetical protein